MYGITRAKFSWGHIIYQFSWGHIIYQSIVICIYNVICTYRSMYWHKICNCLWRVHILVEACVDLRKNNIWKTRIHFFLSSKDIIAVTGFSLDWLASDVEEGQLWIQNLFHVKLATAIRKIVYFIGEKKLELWGSDALLRMAI